MESGLKDQLPRFFVAGAQRAGTTSLHEWLSRAGLARLPRTKETHFFSDPEKYDRGIEWYLRQFPPYVEGQVTGEVAPQYMYSEDAPARIRRWIPAPDFIFILRHPIERAFSNYLMSVRQGREELTFFEALEREEARLRDGEQFARDHFGYIARGRYSRQINRFRGAFPDSRMLFVIFDDLFAPGEGGRATLARVADFLGLKCVVTTGISERENVTSEPRSPVLRDLLYKPHPIKKVARWLIPSRDFRERIGQLLDQLNRRAVAVPMARPPARAIDEAYREIDALEALLGIDLRRWRIRTEEIARLDQLVP